MSILIAKKNFQNVVRRELLNELGNYLLTKYGNVHPEFEFALPKKYRFDFAVPSERIAVEIEGGIHTNGAHSRGAGYQKDLAKYNLATLNGWKVFRFSYNDLKSLTYKHFV